RSLAHDPEKWAPVFPRDKLGARLRGDHAQIRRSTMAPLIVLLRAVNVGGTGKLPMSELKAMCEELGLANVRTYIASGNVVFTSRKSESAVKTALEKRLAAYAGKPVGVLVRTADEMAQVLAENPFPKLAPNRTMAVFLDRAPPSDTLANIRGQRDEKIRL